MKKKVMLAMSGGVDSSAALLLLKDNYEVVGVTLHLFDNPDINAAEKTCCSLSDVEDAKTVASRFGIPHYVYNFNEKFKKDVIDRFNRAYIEGRTPNPCIDCNRYIKFSAMLERALSLECDYMATGHYARVEYDDEKNRWLLKKAIYMNGSDVYINDKDQSYVLYNLTQFQLSRTLFPLGEMKKEEVRLIAEKNGLVNSKKPDSQDICFVPDGDYAKFIQSYTGYMPSRGNITGKNGNVLGEHSGLINYTIGQRRGLGVAFGKPVYVIEKNVTDNTVVVGESDDLLINGLIAGDLNWISVDKPQRMTLKAKTRYKQTEQLCEITPVSGGRVIVEFEKPLRAAAPGQSIVFYDGDIVVCGGIVEEKITKSK